VEWNLDLVYVKGFAIGSFEIFGSATSRLFRYRNSGTLMELEA
jgi:hypothetical protein